MERYKQYFFAGSGEKSAEKTSSGKGNRPQPNPSPNSNTNPNVNQATSGSSAASATLQSHENSATRHYSLGRDTANSGTTTGISTSASAGTGTGGVSAALGIFSPRGRSGKGVATSVMSPRGKSNKNVAVAPDGANGAHQATNTGQATSFATIVAHSQAMAQQVKGTLQEFVYPEEKATTPAPTGGGFPWGGQQSNQSSSHSAQTPQQMQTQAQQQRQQQPQHQKQQPFNPESDSDLLTRRTSEFDRKMRSIPSDYTDGGQPMHSRSLRNVMSPVRRSGRLSMSGRLNTSANNLSTVMNNGNISTEASSSSEFNHIFSPDHTRPSYPPVGTAASSAVPPPGAAAVAATSVQTTRGGKPAAHANPRNKLANSTNDLMSFLGGNTALKDSLKDSSSNVTAAAPSGYDPVNSSVSSSRPASGKNAQNPQKDEGTREQAVRTHSRGLDGRNKLAAGVRNFPIPAAISGAIFNDDDSSNPTEYEPSPGMLFSKKSTSNWETPKGDGDDLGNQASTKSSKTEPSSGGFIHQISQGGVHKIISNIEPNIWTARHCKNQEEGPSTASVEASTETTHGRRSQNKESTSGPSAASSGTQGAGSVASGAQGPREAHPHWRIQIWGEEKEESGAAPQATLKSAGILPEHRLFSTEFRGQSQSTASNDAVNVKQAHHRRTASGMAKVISSLEHFHAKSQPQQPQPQQPHPQPQRPQPHHQAEESDSMDLSQIRTGFQAKDREKHSEKEKDKEKDWIGSKTGSKAGSQVGSPSMSRGASQGSDLGKTPSHRRTNSGLQKVMSNLDQTTHPLWHARVPSKDENLATSKDDSELGTTLSGLYIRQRVLKKLKNAGADPEAVGDFLRKISATDSANTSQDDLGNVDDDHPSEPRLAKRGPAVAVLMKNRFSKSGSAPSVDPHNDSGSDIAKRVSTPVDLNHELIRQIHLKNADSKVKFGVSVGYELDDEVSQTFSRDDYLEMLKQAQLAQQEQQAYSARDMLKEEYENDDEEDENGDSDDSAPSFFPGGANLGIHDDSRKTPKIQTVKSSSSTVHEVDADDDPFLDKTKSASVGVYAHRDTPDSPPSLSGNSARASLREKSPPGPVFGIRVNQSTGDEDEDGDDDDDDEEAPSYMPGLLKSKTSMNSVGSRSPRMTNSTSDKSHLIKVHEDDDTPMAKGGDRKANLFTRSTLPGPEETSAWAAEDRMSKATANTAGGLTGAAQKVVNRATGQSGFTPGSATANVTPGGLNRFFQKQNNSSLVSTSSSSSSASVGTNAAGSLVSMESWASSPFATGVEIEGNTVNQLFPSRSKETKTLSYLECVAMLMKGFHAQFRESLLKSTDMNVWLGPDLNSLCWRKRPASASSYWGSGFRKAESGPDVEKNISETISGTDVIRHEGYIRLSEVFKLKVQSFELNLKYFGKHKQQFMLDMVMDTRSTARMVFAALTCLVPIHTRIKDGTKTINQVVRSYNMFRDTWRGVPLYQLNMVGNYILLNELGSGAFGTVYLAISSDTKKFYAVKVMSKSYLKKNMRQSAFFNVANGKWNIQDMREIAIMKKLHHPNVMTLYGVYDDAAMDSLYLIMEYMPHGVVMDSSKSTSKTTLPEEKARAVFLDAVYGLEFLHQNRVAHRDIKPDNLLVAADGTVKICDFGCSKWYPPDDPSHVGSPGSGASKESGGKGPKGNALERTKTMVGTPAFCAPEDCNSIHAPKGSYESFKADIWSLGASLFYMVYGRVPFLADSAREMFDMVCTAKLKFPDKPAVSDPCRDLLSKLLVKAPNKRYTVEEILNHPWMRASKKSTEVERRDTINLTFSEEDVGQAILRVVQRR